MFSSHAKKRAQQRGVKLHMCRLLRWYGDLVDAGNGTVLRYFSKQAKGRLSALFGARFLAVNHEKLRAFLIEERASGAVVTVGLVGAELELPPQPTVAAMSETPITSAAFTCSDIVQ